jgi:hypothetical protein
MVELKTCPWPQVSLGKNPRHGLSGEGRT